MAIKKKNKRRTTPVRRTSSPVRVTPAFVTPMAAQVVKRLPEGDDWTYELKFDGYRALIIKDKQRVELRSRKNKNLTGMYRGIAAAGLRLNAHHGFPGRLRRWPHGTAYRPAALRNGFGQRS